MVDAQGLIQGGVSAANSINQATQTIVANNPAMQQIQGYLAKANLNRQNSELELQKNTLQFNITAQQMAHTLDVQKMQMAQQQFDKDYVLRKTQISQQQQTIDNQLKLGLGGQAIQEQGVGIQEQQLQQQGSQFQQDIALRQKALDMPQSEIGKFILDTSKQSPGNQALMENLFTRGQIKLPPGYQWGANGGLQQIPGYTSAANQEPNNAAKIGGLKQAQVDWQNAANQIVDPKGNINRTVLATAAVGTPGSTGLQVRNDMYRAAMSYAVAVTPRGASVEQVKAKADSIMPNWKGSAAEIKGQIKAFQNTVGSTLNIISGTSPAEELSTKSGGLSDMDMAQLKMMGYSDDQIKNAMSD